MFNAKLMFFSWRDSYWWNKASSLSRLHDHTHTAQSVGLPWTSDQPDAETSTWQHTTLTRGRHRNRDSSRRPTADPRLRPRGHWDRPKL